jgi:hypothetical protein
MKAPRRAIAQPAPKGVNDQRGPGRDWMKDQWQVTGSRQARSGWLTKISTASIDM